MAKEEANPVDASGDCRSMVFSRAAATDPGTDTTNGIHRGVMEGSDGARIIDMH